MERRHLSASVWLIGNQSHRIHPIHSGPALFPAGEMIWSRGQAALYRPHMSEAAADKQKRPRVNVRRPDVMTQVNAEVERHYRSSIVERIRENGGEITIGNTTVRLAQQFGF